MGCKLAFAAEGVGLSGLSLGIVAVAVGRGSEVSVYKVACSGSTAGFTNCSTLAAMECPDLPSDLESRIVRFKLEGGIGVVGTTEMTFEVFDKDKSDAVYAVKRRPKVRGVIFGGLDALSGIHKTDGAFFTDPELMPRLKAQVTAVPPKPRPGWIPEDSMAG